MCTQDSLQINAERGLIASDRLNAAERISCLSLHTTRKGMIPEPSDGHVLYVYTLCVCVCAHMQLCVNNYIDGTPRVCSVSFHLKPRFAQQMLSSCYLELACMTERI